jgi:hypothetical protein
VLAFPSVLASQLALVFQMTSVLPLPLAIYLRVVLVPLDSIRWDYCLVQGLQLAWLLCLRFEPTCCHFLFGGRLHFVRRGLDLGWVLFGVWCGCLTPLLVSRHRLR